MTLSPYSRWWTRSGGPTSAGGGGQGVQGLGVCPRAACIASEQFRRPSMRLSAEFKPFSGALWGRCASWDASRRAEDAWLKSESSTTAMCQ